MFLGGPGRWSLLVHGVDAALPAVRRWLMRYSPIRIQQGEGIVPRVLRAEFKEVPGRWAELLGAGQVRFIQLTPTGVGSLFLDGDDLSFEAFVSSLQDDAGNEQGRPARGPPSKMTRRQFDALSYAVSVGYYEVPHRVNQREIAEHLGMSLSGVSELLRRAEAHVVTAYVDSLMAEGRDVLALLSQGEMIAPSLMGARVRTD